VTLALEKDWPSVELEVVDEPLPEDDAPAEDEVDPCPDSVVLVCPLIVVDEVTFPPPIVTDDDSPCFIPASLSSLLMIVQVLPSSNVIFSEDAAAAMLPSKISGRATGWLDNARKNFMIFSQGSWFRFCRNQLING
jgi:hypothetical protein